MAITENRKNIAMFTLRLKDMADKCIMDNCSLTEQTSINETISAMNSMLMEQANIIESMSDKLDQIQMELMNRNRG